MLRLGAGLAVVCSLLLGASAYYLPGTYPREFSYGQHVQGTHLCLQAPLSREWRIQVRPPHDIQTLQPLSAIL